MKKLLLAFASIFVVLTNANSEGLDIAPPPISSDLISGETGFQEQKGVSYLNYSSDGFDLNGIGFTLNGKKKSKDSISEMSLGMNLMNGTGSGIDMTLLALNTNFVFGKKVDVATLFIGPNLGMNMTSTNDSSDTTVTYGLSGGVQGDFPVSFGIVTPFYVYRSIYSSDYDITSSQLGFDIYFNKIEMSLSTMMKSDDNGDLLYFALKWVK